MTADLGSACEGACAPQRSIAATGQLGM